MRRRHAAGFTLLETIVTLVIVSLMLALLMQALSQVLNLRQRVLRLQAEARTSALQERWFRESLQGAIADLPDAFGEFEGSQDRLVFTTAVLLTAEGLGRARWELVRRADGMALAYQARGGERLFVVDGPLASAQFDYRGTDGPWRSTWIPEGDDREALPRLVRFRAEGNRGRIHWIVAVPADHTPASNLLRPEDQASGL